MSTPLTTSRITRLIAAGTVGLAGLGATTALLAAPASAAVGPINLNARCSGSSVANLQVQREDTGRLSVDFGVDMARHVAGVPWKVTETQNGTVFVATTVKTIADGSFSLSRSLAPKAGTNTIAARAINVSTGETCALRGAV